MKLYTTKDGIVTISNVLPMDMITWTQTQKREHMIHEFSHVNDEETTMRLIHVPFIQKIHIEGVSSTQDKKLVEQVFRCWLQVIQYHHFTSNKSRLLFPEEPEQVVNIPISTRSWNDVHPLRRYINPRFHVIYDPEFLVIYWSKQLETYDANNMALVPSYPRDIYNRYFSPHEIKQVCDLLQLRWRVEGLPKTLKCASPALDCLVYDPIGFDTLEHTYHIILLHEKDPHHHQQETRDKIRVHVQDLMAMYPAVYKDIRPGFQFEGMKYPIIRGECILGHFLLSTLYYLYPMNISAEDSSNIYRVDQRTLRFLENKVRKVLFIKNQACYLSQYDMDPKSLQPIYIPIQCHWFDKKEVQSILLKAQKPGYIEFLNQMSRMLYCQTVP